MLAGPAQPPEVHALCHWINHALGAPVDLIEPIDPGLAHGDSLRALATDITTGHVETLVVLGCNPAYDTPGELALAKAIATVPFSVHLGLHQDETAQVCRWHLPLSHTLESWSDRRAPDGTASIVQPLIRPLYDTRTAHDVVAMIGGALDAVVLRSCARDLARATPPAISRPGGDKLLHDGVVPNSRFAACFGDAEGRQLPAPRGRAAGPVLAVAPDPSLWDGRYANNAWLQECPKPLTKEVWGNTLSLSAADAAQLGLRHRRHRRIAGRRSHGSGAGSCQRRPGRRRLCDDARLRPHARRRHRQRHRL